jgi:hypothetical protein
VATSTATKHMVSHVRLVVGAVPVDGVAPVASAAPTGLAVLSCSVGLDGAWRAVLN